MSVATARSGPTSRWLVKRFVQAGGQLHKSVVEDLKMSLETILIVVLIVFLLGGGGWYWGRGRG